MTASNGLLNNKVVVVTGGAGLLGRTFVRAVVLSGGVGVVADLNEDAGVKAMEQLKGELRSENLYFIKVDITSKESINDMIGVMVKRYGKIDAVINSAYPRSRNYGRKLEDVTFDDFCQNVNLHLGGYFLVSQQMALYFKKQGYGNIINLSSIYGVMAPRFEAYEGTKMTMPVEYAAIKSAIIHLTKYMAKYYKGSNIRVNAISPGGVLDGQPEPFLDRYRSFCLNKGMLEGEDLCGTILYLLSDLSSFVNGQNIIVDDGYSL
jgi:NAD(P)-dependent dehydrogenase (short-subunit alcohol dehydrogenase family)